MFIGDQTTLLVSHSLSQNDLRSIEKILNKLNEILKQKNIGRLINSKKSICELVSKDASHHIGGTRISLKGDDGVVSSDLKVIG